VLRTVTAVESLICFRHGSSGAEDNVGRGSREVRPVVLTDTEYVEAHLVSKLYLFQQICEPGSR
jgi:hypothetical protein